ncbi:uncharacterized protein LOC114749664 [Neltuma alba]|uniref:uncharacterized protein LOC114749664 n=1 Tax=Neltuma alba TaxID=207710 RepID=UPI0010A463F6|nr:uncharacterized protein LOC114749664 [Prosopis alba]
MGGLVRDIAVRWRIGFQRRLGFHPPTQAELMALLTGLQMCKQQGFSKIMVFTDSIEAIRLVETEGGANHFLHTEITEIREHIYSDWDISIKYARRSALQCADMMAKKAQVIHEEMIYWQRPPRECLSQLQDDMALATISASNF